MSGEAIPRLRGSDSKSPGQRFQKRQLSAKNGNFHPKTVTLSLKNGNFYPKTATLYHFEINFWENGNFEPDKRQLSDK